MKTSLFIFMLMVVNFASYAQRDVPTTEPEKLENLHLIKGSLLGVGYSYEHALNSKWTISGNVDLGNNLALSVSGAGNYFYWGLSPNLNLEARYYYNYQKRQLKGKKVKHNSANYLSASAYWFTGSIDVVKSGYYVFRDYNYSFQAKWGFRRALGEHFTFDLSLGLALNLDNRSYNYISSSPILISSAFWVGFGYRL